MLNYSDDKLLSLFNDRDIQAFGIVYRKLYREFHLYAECLFKPLNQPAEDLIQDVFVDIWKRRSIQFSSLEYIKSFGFIALKNAYKNKLKQLKHRQKYELEYETAYAPDKEEARKEQYKTLYELIRQLPGEYSIILQRYLEGFKPEEIASELHIALQTVYNRRREAILLLRKLSGDCLLIPPLLFLLQ